MTDTRKRTNTPILIERDYNQDEPAKKKIRSSSDCDLPAPSQPSSANISDASNLLLLSKSATTPLSTEAIKKGEVRINILSDDEEECEPQNGDDDTSVTPRPQIRRGIYKSDTFDLPLRLDSGKCTLPQLPIGRPLPSPPRLPRMSSRPSISFIC